MTSHFKRLHAVLKTARFPLRGKPLEHGTSARISEGTREEPLVITLRLHKHDIAVLYADGSRSVRAANVAGIFDRLWTHAGIVYQQHTMPTFNGRLPYPKERFSFRLLGQQEVVNAASRVTFLPDGTPDLRTVLPASFYIISDPKAARAAMRKASAIYTQLDVHNRLGATPGRDAFGPWIVRNLHRPLNEIPYHEVGHVTTVLSHYKFEIAQVAGATRLIALKEFPTMPVKM